MGRARDPKRDQAFEIYKASGGKINLNVIAAQLGIGDGTLRGWKAKDKWEKEINPSQELRPLTKSKKQLRSNKLMIQKMSYMNKR